MMDNVTPKSWYAIQKSCNAHVFLQIQDRSQDPPDDNASDSEAPAVRAVHAGRMVEINGLKFTLLRAQDLTPV